MTLEKRLAKAIDDPGLGYQIHITPITTRSNVSGIALQGNSLLPPLPVVNGAQDRLFTSDEGQFTLQVINDAGPEMRPNPLIVTLDIEGITDDFLTDENGHSLPSSLAWSLLPGEVQELTVQTLQLASEQQLRRTTEDRLYGARFRLQAWEANVGAEASL